MKIRITTTTTTTTTIGGGDDRRMPFLQFPKWWTHTTTITFYYVLVRSTTEYYRRSYVPVVVRSIRPTPVPFSIYIYICMYNERDMCVTNEERKRPSLCSWCVEEHDVVGPLLLACRTGNYSRTGNDVGPWIHRFMFSLSRCDLW